MLVEEGFSMSRPAKRAAHSRSAAWRLRAAAGAEAGVRRASVDAACLALGESPTLAGQDTNDRSSRHAIGSEEDKSVKLQTCGRG